MRNLVREAVIYWPLGCAAAMVLAQKLGTAPSAMMAALGMALDRPHLRVIDGDRERREALEREVLGDAVSALEGLIARLPAGSPWRWAFRSARAEIVRDLEPPAGQSSRQNVR